MKIISYQIIIILILLIIIALFIFQDNHGEQFNYYSNYINVLSAPLAGKALSDNFKPSHF